MMEPGTTVGLTDTIKALCSGYHGKVVELRRHFHRHPELGLKEYGTAKIVAEELRKLGIEVTEGVQPGDRLVVADITKPMPNPFVG